MRDRMAGRFCPSDTLEDYPRQELTLYGSQESVDFAERVELLMRSRARRREGGVASDTVETQKVMPR